MTRKILLIGQSNGLGLETGIASALNAATNRSYSVLQACVGGSALLKACAQSSFPDLYWLNRYVSTSPLGLTLAMDLTGVEAVQMVHGEQDANTSAVTVEAYLGALQELRAVLCATMGKTSLPFVISPLGNAARLYTNGWMVDRAQAEAVAKFGFIQGAEYIDLATESDNIHLTSASQATFAARIGAQLADVVGRDPAASGGSFNVASGVLNRDISLTTTFGVTGLSFQPKIVLFNAAYGQAYSSWDGRDTGSAATCTYDDGVTADTYKVKSDYSIYISGGSTATAAMKISSMNSDGFTITPTKTGTPGGTVSIPWTALG